MNNCVLLIAITIGIGGLVSIFNRDYKAFKEACELSVLIGIGYLIYKGY